MSVTNTTTNSTCSIWKGTADALKQLQMLAKTKASKTRAKRGQIAPHKMHKRRKGKATAIQQQQLLLL